MQKKKRRQLTWDKKKKKFIKGDGAGADNVKLVRTESGAKLPASYRSGRYNEWKSKTRVSLPQVGQAENPARPGMGSRRFKHSKVMAAKPLDKLRADYERKTRQLKKQDGSEQVPNPGRKGTRRYGDKSYGRVKSELKTIDQIKKMRKMKDQRKAKNARPSKNKRR